MILLLLLSNVSVKNSRQAWRVHNLVLILYILAVHLRARFNFSSPLPQLSHLKIEAPSF